MTSNKDDDPWAEGGAYDKSFQNAVEEVAPQLIADPPLVPTIEGPWYVQILWNDAQPYDPVAGMRWVSSWAHRHVAVLGHPTMEHAQETLWSELDAMRAGDHVDVLDRVFRGRIVYSEDGPPPEVESRVKVYVLGVEL